MIVRRRNTVRTLTIALLAAIPIASCSDDSDQTSSAITTSTVSATAPEATADTAGPRRDTSVFAGAEDVHVSFALPAGWETRDVFVLQPDDDELSVYVTFFAVD